jgi:hypothetical protein
MGAMGAVGATGGMGVSAVAPSGAEADVPGAPGRAGADATGDPGNGRGTPPEVAQAADKRLATTMKRVRERILVHYRRDSARSTGVTVT